MFVSAALFYVPAVGAKGLVESTQRTLVAIKSLEIFSQGGQPAEADILSCRGASQSVCGVKFQDVEFGQGRGVNGPTPSPAVDGKMWRKQAGFTSLCV